MSTGFDVLFYKLKVLEEEISKNQTQAGAWRNYMKRSGKKASGNNYSRFIKKHRQIIAKLKVELPNLYDDLCRIKKMF